MEFKIDGKEYRAWFEYKTETIGHPKPTSKKAPTVIRVTYCYLSDPDETWRLVAKVIRFKHFSRIIARKQALGKVLQMQWDRDHRDQRREAWAQIFKQMRRGDEPR